MMLIVLVAGVVIQFMLTTHTPLPDDPALAARRAHAPAAAMIPDYPAVLRTPIFAPDRAPGETLAAPSAGGAAVGLQVLGLGSTGRTATAIVRSPDGATHVLQPGQVLQGWRLVSVLKTAAVLIGPNGRTTVPLGAPATSADAVEATPATAGAQPGRTPS